MKKFKNYSYKNFTFVLNEADKQPLKIEIIYRAATNFGSKPVEPKTKQLSKKFCQVFKVFTTHRTKTHNRIRIYFFLEITQNKLTKSI